MPKTMAFPLLTLLPMASAVGDIGRNDFEVGTPQLSGSQDERIQYGQIGRKLWMPLQGIRREERRDLWAKQIEAPVPSHLIVVEKVNECGGCLVG
jgi:hypothetical protein